MYPNSAIDNTISSPASLSESKEKRNLYLFSMGKAVSLLGTYIYNFAVSLYILKITGSGTSFALSILLGTLPRVILSPIAGSVSDRVNRRKMIVLLDITSGVTVLLLFLQSILFGIHIPFIYLTTFILSGISTFFNNCFLSALPRLVSDKSLFKINSYNRAIDSGSSILGPVLAGMVFGFVSLQLFLFINGISFILSALSELFIDFDYNISKEEEKPSESMSLRVIWKDAKEVITFIKGNPILSLILPFSMTFNFLISACLTVILPFQINTVLGLSSAEYGIVEGSFSVGMLTAALLISRLPEKNNKRRGLSLGLVGMGISLMIMGVPGFPVFNQLSKVAIFIVYVVMAVIFAFFLLYIDLPLGVLIQRSIPGTMLGRVMGIIGTLASSLIPIGIILAGLTLEIIPAYLIFIITGLYFIVSASILYTHKAMKEY